MSVKESDQFNVTEVRAGDALKNSEWLDICTHMLHDIGNEGVKGVCEV